MYLTILNDTIPTTPGARYRKGKIKDGKVEGEREENKNKATIVIGRRSLSDRSNRVAYSE